MIYYIYHIPLNKKVGCTNNLERRMAEQSVRADQVDTLQILFDAEEASQAEEDWRNHFKYKPDSTNTYIETLNQNQNQMKRPPREKIHPDSMNVGINEKLTSKVALLAYLNEDPEMILGTEGGTYKFTRQHYPDLADQAIPSKFGDFFWTNVILKNIHEDDEGDIVHDDYGNPSPTIPQFELVREWAEERGLYAKGDNKTQMLKLMEEVGETSRAILKNDEHEIEDGLGDILVVLINLSHLSGYKLEDCLATAYEVISKRKGKMINGTFVKN